MVKLGWYETHAGDYVKVIELGVTVVAVNGSRKKFYYRADGSAKHGYMHSLKRFIRDE